MVASVFSRIVAASFAVLASDGTGYSTDRTVLASDGASYLVSATVFASDGTSYNPI